MDKTFTNDDGEEMDTRLKSYKLLDFVNALYVSDNSFVLKNGIMI